ncbi:DUF1566 domain-containing protein [Marinobacter xestospongiae]|uniref:Lcl C-terminal domain-containing protein n=1 Tax=Marinobacter xestospongiae TaxID=994319 RepID=UPI002006B812|nr:DUF1566 domain-containing protein [Marinobacter xestospongiae]MCK7565525.1 DUF1566 domain-containing protein [Marinobacter xestospongiae]
MQKRFSALVMASAFTVLSASNVYAAPECKGESLTPDSQFTLMEDQVLDKKTELVWKRCAEGMSWNDGACAGEAAQLTYEEAIARYDEDGSGWRLPDSDELMGLRAGRAYASGCIHPALNTTAFPGEEQVGGYWSSTPSYMSGAATSVDFRNGAPSDGTQRSKPLRIRLVKNQ